MTGDIILSNYKIIRQIGEGGMSHVYLAQSNEDPHSRYAVKILKDKISSQRIEDIIRFHNESKIVSSLSHSNIVKVKEVGEFEDSKGNTKHFIVMEFIEGQSLLHYIKQGPRLSIDESLSLIKELISTLDYIHGKGLIHRDLKPGNILLKLGPGKEIETLKIIDFGLAQIRELSEIQEKEYVTGTFSYLSPEQLGLIKKNVDERSDLYSLGILFYQVITGELPYKSDTVSALVHMHAAKMPKPPTFLNKNIPKMIERIILKLLEKEPENRYQSAKGLLYDIEKFQQSKSDFILGMNDKNVKLNFRSRLVGRSEELNNLIKLLEKTAGSNGAVSFIGGEAGLGKSRLIEEFKSKAVFRQALILESKCFSGENKLPFGPFKEIYDCYIRYFQKLEKEEKSKLIEELNFAASDFGSLIVKMNPLLNDIINESSQELVQLDSEKENQRFLNANSQFLLKLSQIHKPVILLIDDVQWIDSSSVDLLDKLLQDSSHFPIMILLSFRNNEIVEEMPIFRLMQDANKNNQNFMKIILKPFNLEGMKVFMSELLFENEEETQEIAEFILKKGNGNPYFSIEILKHLIDQKAIEFKQNKWSIAQEAMDKVTIPSNLIDLILQKIPKIDKKMMEILSHAAVIGRKFSINLLFSLCPYSKEEIVLKVDDAIHLQMLEQNHEERGRIIFVHDRIKEAFYSNLGEIKKKEIHLKIGLLLESMDENNEEKSIFDLANHFIECGEQEKILKYCEPAALKAKESFANEESIYYFNQIIPVLKEKNYMDKLLHVMHLSADVHLLVGKNAEAIEIAQEALQWAKTKIQKAEFYKLICTGYYKQGALEQGEYYGKIGLKYLGERLPIGRFSVMIRIVKEFIIQIMHLTFPKWFTSKKSKDKNQKVRLLNSFYFTLNWIYLIMDIVKFIRTELRMLNLTERHMGPSKELGLAMTNHAGLLMSIPLFKNAYKYLTKSIEIRNRLEDRYGLAQSYQSMGFYHMFKGELQESIQSLEKSISEFEKMGDKKEAGMSYAVLFYVYQLLSDYNKSKIVNHQCFEIFQPMKDSHGICLFYYNNSLLCLEQGFLEESLEWASKNHDLSLKDKNWFLHTGAIGIMGAVFYEKNEIQKGIEYLEKARNLDKTHKFLRQYMCLLYHYLADLYIEEYKIRDAEGKERKNLLKKIDRATKEAIKHSNKWMNHYAGALRIRGKYFVLCGDYLKAEQLFIQSITLAEKYGRRFEEAKSLYDYGLFLKQIHQKDKSLQILEKAYNIFQDIGAHHYVKKTSEALGIKQASSIQKLIDRQKLTSIIKVSQDISMILDLDVLLEKIVAVILEVTGAQRGFFFVKNPKTGELEVKAKKNVSQNNEQDYSRSVVSEVFRTGEPLLGSNAQLEEKFNHFHSVAEYHLKSIICIPVRYKNEIKGVCYLDSKIMENLFSEDDLELLFVFTSQAAIAMENAQLHTEMVEKARLSKEFEIAKDIQISMLPIIDHVPGYNISAYLRSASEVSGDYYDFYTAESPYLGIFGDVAGHGLKSGLIMMMVDVAFNAIIKNKAMRKESLSELYQQMNLTLYENIQTRLFQKSKQGREYAALYSTLRLFRFDEQGNFEIFGNDHAQPFICRKDSGIIEPIKSTGMLLGMLENGVSHYQPDFFKLNSGDLLVFYSDGIVEAKMKRKNEIHRKEIHQYIFGEERFYEIVKKNRHTSPEKIIHEVIQSVDQFMLEQDDDMTMVVIQKK